MSLDAFSPPGDGPLQQADPPEHTLDPHVEAANGTLWVMGIACVLLAIAMPLVGGPGAATDPDFEGLPLVFGVAIGGVAGLFVLAPGVLFLVGAVGLGRRTAWGWIVGVVAFAIMAAFCTPPLAMHGLYALLRPGVREDFQ